MEKIDISKLKRDNKLKQLIYKKGESLFCREDCEIYLPAKYVEKKIAYIDDTVKTVGVVCLVIKDKYVNMLIPTMVDVTPVTTEIVEMDKQNFYKLSVDKGLAIIDSTTVVKDASAVYPMFDLFILQGKIPWFVNYNDVFKIFNNLSGYTTSNIGDEITTLSSIISLIARDDKDPTTYYRMNTKNKIKWVGLKDINYSFKSTIGKLAGNYMKDGMIAAVVNPESKGNSIADALK